MNIYDPLTGLILYEPTIIDCDTFRPSWEQKEVVDWVKEGFFRPDRRYATDGHCLCAFLR